MNKLLVILALSALMSLSADWSEAIAQDNNIKQIAPEDAVLDVDSSGSALISVHAGHIAKKLYVEDWRYNDFRVVYTRLSGRTFFKSGVLSEEKTQSRYCGENAEQNCEVMQLTKHSKNLIVIAYRQRSSGLVCAGMDYIDETRSSSRHRGLFGNYIVSVETCVPGGAAEEVIAQAAHYLLAIKSNGNTIAKLGHYDLPKLN
jgi:hypothetical protein